MMEINRVTDKRDDRSRVKKKQGGASRAGSVSQRGISFADTLASAINFDFTGTIDELLVELKQQEQQFLNNPTIFEMSRYKAMVSRILKMALEQGAQTAEIRSSSWRGERISDIVKIVDAKILELQKTLIAGSPAFSLMKTMEEIRGLILDIIS